VITGTFAANNLSPRQMRHQAFALFLSRPHKLNTSLLICHGWQSKSSMISFPPILYFFVVLLLLGPWSANAARASAAGPEKTLGVRLSLNDKQFDPNAFCSKEERRKIRNSLWMAMGHPIKRVRSGERPLAQCVELCQESSPGHCFLAHLDCQGWGALTESSPIEGSLASDSYADPNPDAKPLDYVTGGRFLSTGPRTIVISSSMKKTCNASKDAVVVELKKLALGLQPSCQRLLRKEVEISCFML
jgi:hypothetical protein